MVFEKTDNGAGENVEFRQGIDVSRGSNKRHRVETASFAGEIQAVFYGPDMARMLKALLSELLLGNIGGRNTDICEKR